MKTKKQFTNRIFSLVLALVMVVGMLPMTALAVNTLQQDSDGYYLIANENDLFEFAQIVNGNHSSIAKNTSANGKLTADITMTGETKPWTPIASSRVGAEQYAGTFDGQGHTISKLYFNDTAAFSGGLFGYVNGGTIRNVTIADGYIAAIWGGAIAGRCFGSGRIEGCGNLNTAVAAGETGGIVGITDSTIIACWNTGTISGSTWAGGICAYLQGTVKGCWNTGKITGERCGGIVGAVGGSRTVAYCYNDGMVVSSDNDLEGAIIGSNNGSGRPKMSDCYYTYPHGGAYKAYGEEYDYYYTNVDDVSSSMLPTGEGALFLNQGLEGTGYQYYQNLDNGKTVDAYPITDSSHGTVHQGYKVCSDAVSYSNNALSQSIYHEGVSYKAEGQSVNEVCTNEACRISKGLGSITLDVSSEYYYTGNPVKATVTGALQTGATHKITYNGSEEATGQVGNHTAKLTVYEGSEEKAGVSANFKISYLPSLGIYKEVKFSGSNYDSDGVCWFAPRAVATVIAPEGYMISTALDGAYGAFVYLDEGDNKTVYFKRASDGAMTDAVDLSARLKWDTSAPTGRVELATGNFWTNLINKITFGMFFKERQTVTITAEDTESGVKSVQYYYDYEDLISDPSLSSAEVAARLENAIGDDWEDYNGSFELEFDGKYIVYVKLTDNVGNVTYISSNGLVQYSDATSDTTSLTTTYKAGEDRDISVELNNNTVKEVGYGNAALTAADYTVSGDKITLKSAYLDTLVAGNYTITISLNPQGVPYVDSATNEKPAELMVSLTVNKREVAVPSADTQSFVYDGSEQTYSIASSEWYTVTDNKKTDAGTYTVTVVLKDKDNTVWSDGTTEDKTYEFYIAKADQAAPTGLTKTDTTYFGKADGKISGLTSAMEFCKEGDSAYTAGFNGTLEYLAAGTYYVRYQGDANHNPSPDAVVTVNAGRKLQIVVPQNQVGYTVTVNKTEMEYEGSYTLKVEIQEGYTATENFKIIISNWERGQQAGVEETYMNAIADQIIEVQGVADITPPTAEIKIEENKWTCFWNNLTFGLFFKETQDVTITANDVGSGVKSIQYYLSDSELELDEAKAITDWIDYNGTFKIEPNNYYVVYARVTDNAGNILYINSNGIVLDNIAPTLEGIENEKTYYGDLTVIKSDEQFYDIKMVTLDGEPMGFAESTYGLIPADNAEHIVVVEDHAGNKITYTVTVMKNYTVTYKADGEPFSTETVGHGKDATLPAVPAKNGYVGKWDSDGKNITGDTTITVVYTEIPVVKPNEVKPENKTDLEDTKKQLEDMLKDDSYTDEDKKNIQDAIDDIDDALEVIGNVEAVEELIDKLPAVDTVKPDDEEAIKAITDAQTAYNALSDYEKSLVDEATKANLDKLVAALVAYDIVEGDGSSWTEDSNHNITFVVNGLFSKFVGIKVDGKDVDKANYEVKAGSTIITLKESYLDTLAVGEHTITVVYTDGSTDGTFNVHAKANSPATGDNSHMFLWIALLFISGGAVITLTVVDRKRRMASNR